MVQIWNSILGLLFRAVQEYNSLTAIVGAQSAKFEAYVNNGGIFRNSRLYPGKAAWPNGFPFGFQFYTSVEENVNVVDSSSAIMNTPYVVTTSSLDNWDMVNWRRFKQYASGYKRYH